MGGDLVRRCGPWTLAELVEHLADARPVYVAARRFPTPLIREALASGLVGEWEDSPVGRAVLLSALECERRGLELADDLVGDALEHSRWVSIRSRRTTPSRPPAEEAVDLDDVAGDAPEPIDALIAREEQEAPADRGGRRSGHREPPRPIVILGSTFPCWSRSVERPGVDPCRVCGGRLRAIEYCLGCSRSGVDARLPATTPPKPSRPRRPALARA